VEARVDDKIIHLQVLQASPCVVASNGSAICNQFVVAPWQGFDVTYFKVQLSGLDARGRSVSCRRNPQAATRA